MAEMRQEAGFWNTQPVLLPFAQAVLFVNVRGPAFHLVVPEEAAVQLAGLGV